MFTRTRISNDEKLHLVELISLILLGIFWSLFSYALWHIFILIKYSVLCFVKKKFLVEDGILPKRIQENKQLILHHLKCVLC